jgi:hypothetical protein
MAEKPQFCGGLAESFADLQSAFVTVDLQG